jgi:hypothetical protein
MQRCCQTHAQTDPNASPTQNRLAKAAGHSRDRLVTVSNHAYTASALVLWLSAAGKACSALLPQTQQHNHQRRTTHMGAAVRLGMHTAHYQLQVLMRVGTIIMPQPAVACCLCYGFISCTQKNCYSIASALQLQEGQQTDNTRCTMLRTHAT